MEDIWMPWDSPISSSFISNSLIPRGKSKAAGHLHFRGGHVRVLPRIEEVQELAQHVTLCLLFCDGGKMFNLALLLLGGEKSAGRAGRLQCHNLMGMDDPQAIFTDDLQVR